MTVPSTRTLPPETAFRLVTSARRRRVLRVLFDAGRELRDRALARRVAARREDTAPEAVAAETVDETLLTVRHTDLPKLDEAGVVRYDAEERVELRPASEDLRPLLRYAGGGDL